MGALKWGRKGTLCNLRAIVYNCALLWPFGAPFQGKLSSQNDDNRRQSWTIVDKYLKPPFAKTPFRLSRRSDLKVRLDQIFFQIAGASGNYILFAWP